MIHCKKEVTKKKGSGQKKKKKKKPRNAVEGKRHQRQPLIIIEICAQARIALSGAEKRQILILPDVIE